MAELRIPQPMDVVGEFVFYTDEELGKGNIMSKGSNAAKAHKSHKSRSANESPTKGSGWGVQRKKVGGHRKQIREIKSSSGNDNASDNFKKFAEGKKSKNGCLPRVFMMLLPFMVVGAYFVFSL